MSNEFLVLTRGCAAKSCGLFRFDFQRLVFKLHSFVLYFKGEGKVKKANTHIVQKHAVFYKQIYVDKMQTCNFNKIQ